MFKGWCQPYSAARCTQDHKIYMWISNRNKESIHFWLPYVKIYKWFSNRNKESIPFWLPVRSFCRIVEEKTNWTNLKATKIQKRKKQLS